MERYSTSVESPIQNKHTPVGIITHNIYQLPWYVALYCRFFKSDVPIDNCTDQYGRAVRLCDLLALYDICALQEMWGANSAYIVERLNDDFHFPEKLVSYIPDSSLWQDVKTIRAMSNNKIGGLMFAVKQDMPIIWYKHHNFAHNEGEEEAYKSVGFCLLDMNAYWKKKYLLVVNVHFHSLNPHDDTIVREQQRGEVFQQFKNLHTKQLFPLDFAWDNCGVIFMGDFNAAYMVGLGHMTDEYRKLLEAFSPGGTHDLYAEMHSENVLGYTYDSDNNKYVNCKTLKDTSRMDYIFSLDSIPSPTPTNRRRTMPLQAVTCTILMQTPDKQTCMQ